MAIINGDGNDNFLPGTEDDDVINGFDGNDFIIANGGNDVIDGVDADTRGNFITIINDIDAAASVYDIIAAAWLEEVRSTIACK